MSELRDFECEVCGLKETLTNEQAFEGGWDWPPFMGIARVISPRTCGDCGIEDTVWWKLMEAQQTGVEFVPTEKQRAVILRIQAEEG